MNGLVSVLGQSSQNGGSAIGAIVFLLVYLAILVGVIAGFWKTFVKAGQPGWAIFIPIFNLYVMCKIAGRPGWWIILMLIPIVGLIMFVILSIDIAKSFGKDAGFGVGLGLLSFIFYPILGFGSAEYRGPAAA